MRTARGAGALEPIVAATAAEAHRDVGNRNTNDACPPRMLAP
jgi:hypothetical protein